MICLPQYLQGLPSRGQPFRLPQSTCTTAFLISFVSLGVTYGFKREWDATKKEHGPVQALAPKCAGHLSAPSLRLSWGEFPYADFKTAVDDAQVNYDSDDEWESLWYRP